MDEVRWHELLRVAKNIRKLEKRTVSRYSLEGIEIQDELKIARKRMDKIIKEIEGDVSDKQEELF